nr:AAA family ATPase [Anaerolineae bacterium]
KAEVFITAKSYYRRRPRAVVDAERRGLPIYVLRANTVAQMEACLADIFNLTPAQSSGFAAAMRETEEAIRRVLEGVPSVELSPQSASIRRRQHEMAHAARLASESRGKEPRRRVRIYREE